MPRLVYRERVPKATADRILKFIRRGTTLANAAEVSGISRDTFYDWVKRGESGEDGYVKFAQDVRVAKAEAEAAIFTIVRASMGRPKGPGSPDVTYAWKWLSVRNRAEYAEHHVLTGAGGGPIELANVDVTKLSDEDLKKILAGEWRPPPPAAPPPRAEKAPVTPTKPELPPDDQAQESSARADAVVTSEGAPDAGVGSGVGAGGGDSPLAEEPTEDH
jgi:hypothetical protein